LEGLAFPDLDLLVDEDGADGAAALVDADGVHDLVGVEERGLGLVEVVVGQARVTEAAVVEDEVLVLLLGQRPQSAAGGGGVDYMEGAEGLRGVELSRAGTTAGRRGQSAEGRGQDKTCAQRAPPPFPRLTSDL